MSYFYFKIYIMQQRAMDTNQTLYSSNKHEYVSK